MLQISARGEHGARATERVELSGLHPWLLIAASRSPLHPRPPARPPSVSLSFSSSLLPTATPREGKQESIQVSRVLCFKISRFFLLKFTFFINRIRNLTRVEQIAVCSKVHIFTNPFSYLCWRSHVSVPFPATAPPPPPPPLLPSVLQQFREIRAERRRRGIGDAP